MKNEFKVGDQVTSNDFVSGVIVEIEGEFAQVEFWTGNGGGCLPFYLSELEKISDTKSETTADNSEEEIREIASIIAGDSNCFNRGRCKECNRQCHYLSTAKNVVNYYKTRRA